MAALVSSTLPQRPSRLRIAMVVDGVFYASVPTPWISSFCRPSTRGLLYQTLGCILRAVYLVGERVHADFIRIGIRIVGFGVALDWVGWALVSFWF